MESFKIEHFKKYNPTKDFPTFNTLTPVEAQEIYTRLSAEIGKIIPRDHLIKIINNLSTSVKDVNTNNDEFLLESVFSRLNIQPNEKIYINWYQFDDIDEMRFDDLNKYFDDIWYPSSDDIDIFDSTFSWFLCISHDGNVKYLVDVSEVLISHHMTRPNS